MALHIGSCIIAGSFLCLTTAIKAQKVYYPSEASDLLKSTAQDLAELFNRSIPASFFTTDQYNSTLPQTGIVFIYDSSITNNQSCKIESNGSSVIKFSASQDNGLCFGIYSYLKTLGFRFYLPGSIWEKIPLLSSPYQTINKTVTGNFKYNNWFISGGNNRWAMDNDSSYGWDVYYGKNGHQWAKYQRRNNMTGAYRFNGHRGDIFNSEYINALQAHPCYVACYNGSRSAGVQSVPDINNNNAKQFWAAAIQQNFSDYKNIISNNPSLYKNQYHNFNYYNQFLGIEVSDGANWGNSTDNSGCAIGNFNGKPYPDESDQQFLLSNFTAEKIGNVFPDKHFQCYAYSGHAGIPSSSITINNNIDVQVVAGAFQFETSTKGLLNRWYQRHSNISEYHYLNIPQWTGETPMFSLDEYKNTLLRVKEKNSDGIVMEASPAKFVSLPFLFAGNRYLLDNTSIDSSLDEFVSAMFPSNAGVHIRQLLKYWGDENVFTVGNFTNDNKYKIPLYLQELNLAVTSSQNAATEVTARLQELKAYMHYLILYFDFITDPKPYENKTLKAEALCLYLAKINKLQLVNSYFLIQNVVNKYPATHTLYYQYNITNGTAYFGGNLSPITDQEINNNFYNDVSRYSNTVSNYKFKNAADIISKMNGEDLKPLEKINVKIRYTNGYEYSNRSEFYFYAPTAGFCTVTCTPHFGIAGKGFINIIAEADDKPLFIIKDETITPGTVSANIKINIPSAGMYKLSFVSKFKTSADVVIITNGNIFFKKGPFYGDRVEDYSDDWSSLPKYFYVPQASGKLYFSVNNACPYNNSCVSPSDIQKAFSIRDNNGEIVTVQASASDSSLFKMEVPPAAAGKFWEVFKMREYNLCFANIANIEIYAERKFCTNADFAAKLIFNGNDCYTKLTAFSNDHVNMKWEIYDADKWYKYAGIKNVELPVVISPKAIITLKNANCSVTKKAGNINGYINSFSSCAAGAPLPDLSNTFTTYPNPSTRVFNFKINGFEMILENIEIYNAQAKLITHFTNTSSIDLSNFSKGIYFYKATKENYTSHGKLIKN